MKLFQNVWQTELRNFDGTGEPAASEVPPQEAAPTPEAPPVTPAPAPEPEQYSLNWDEVTVPEGFTLEGELGTEFRSVAEELQFSAAQTTKVLEMAGKLTSATLGGYEEAWNQKMDAWVNEIRNDPEIGGDKFSDSMQRVGAVVDAYGTKELRELLDTTGLGNNIHLVRFLAKIGDDFRTKPPVTTELPARSMQDRASRIYTNTPQQRSQ